MSAHIILKDAPTISWAFSTSMPHASVTLGGNRALFITGLANGDRGLVSVRQDDVGGRTLSLPADSKVKDRTDGIVELTAAPGAIDILIFTHDGTCIHWDIAPMCSAIAAAFRSVNDRWLHRFLRDCV